mmetsp:Transcript_35614/g.46875  ORF Transcript_35614/g.46875 Transcript_35614/m.46875 type:complete len:86 (+) Transcript_35614:226-483(+)
MAKAVTKIGGIIFGVIFNLVALCLTYHIVCKGLCAKRKKKQTREEYLMPSCVNNPDTPIGVWPEPNSKAASSLDHIDQPLLSNHY